MTDLIERVLLLGIGAASLTKEKVEAVVDEFVKRGQLTREEGQNLMDKAGERAKDSGVTFKEKVSDTYQDTLRTMGIATTDQVDELERRIVVLEAKVYGKPGRFEEPATGFVVTETEEEEPH